ncbi:hypothetical protein CBR_g77849 [Chara braunii]|uniref:Uncharacterized protein n=1 Tax=Chara braunii TaxID=69332 RepID=A0A388JKH1_CHABU|nr:hypothetical protein CBR_g77849 [Chara braunii]|eukprot:GBG44367.1 hypothetical protein CBR_g77849 [Chara braunii]
MEIVNVIFQSQSFVNSCLYFSQTDGFHLYGFHPFIGETGPTVLLNFSPLNTERRNDVVVTRDGCHLFYSVGRRLRTADVRKQCSQVENDNYEMGYRGGTLMGLALMQNEVGEDTYLYMGSDDGKLFEVQLNRSGRRCVLEAEPSIPPAPEGVVESKPSNPTASGPAITVLVASGVAGTVVAMVIIGSSICLWRRARRPPAGPERLPDVGEQATSSLMEDEALDAWGIKPSRVKQFIFRVLSECKNWGEGSVWEGLQRLARRRGGRDEGDDG